jgi:superfamily I DNA/RNA helicase
VGWHLKAEGVPVRTRRRPERTPERQLAVAALGALVSRGEFAVARYWRARMGVAAADERISREYRIGTGFIVLDEDAELKRTPESLGDDLRALDVDPESVAELEALRDGLRTSESDPTLADVALAAEEREELDQGDGVTVTTIHGAKGREWHTVILAGFEDEVIPGRHQDEVDEERRVAYVGMTRAKRGLWLSYARARRRWWGDNRLAPSTPSRFIAEAGL